MRTRGKARRIVTYARVSTASTICTVFTPVFATCSAIASPSVRLVRKNLATCGGTERAIRAMSSSSIGPGPLGIAATRPIAHAPCSSAISASCTDAMQHTFKRVATLALLLAELETPREHFRQHAGVEDLLL